MPAHASILVIDDSPGECELFHLALRQTSLDVELFIEHNAAAALHRLQTASEPTDGSTGSEHPPRTAKDEVEVQGRSILRNQRQALPSLILLDWYLGNQRGAEFLKRLRVDSRLAAIPVVVFSTSDDAADMAAAYGHGANGYVVKPDTFDELVQYTGDLCRYWLMRNRTPHRIEVPC